MNNENRKLQRWNIFRFARKELSWGDRIGGGGVQETTFFGQLNFLPLAWILKLFTAVFFGLVSKEFVASNINLKFNV
jgi:hypothetical protein